MISKDCALERRSVGMTAVSEEPAVEGNVLWCDYLTDPHRCLLNGAWLIDLFKDRFVSTSLMEYMSQAW